MAPRKPLALPFSGHLLRVARERAGMYQQHLAEACGVDRSSISALEIGRVMPSPPLLRKLAEALGCSVDDLLDAVDQDQAVPA